MTFNMLIVSNLCLYNIVTALCIWNYDSDEETAWVCGICGKSMLKKELLIEHKKSHEKLEPPTPNGQGKKVLCAFALYAYHKLSTKRHEA